MNTQPFPSSESSQEDNALAMTSKGWLSRLKVVHKIALGYALVVGVFVAGTAIGALIARRYENEAYEGNEDTIEEILSIKNLEKELNQLIANKHQLITWLDDPEQFKITYDRYQSSTRDFQEDWSELLAEYEEDVKAGVKESEEELKLLEILVEDYGGVIEINLQEI